LGRAICCRRYAAVANGPRGIIAPRLMQNLNRRRFHCCGGTGWGGLGTEEEAATLAPRGCPVALNAAPA